MQDAINVFYYLFTKFINFIFNSYILQGVSLGWVLLTISVFGILISSILNVPTGLISSAIKNRSKRKE